MVSLKQTASSVFATLLTASGVQADQAAWGGSVGKASETSALEQKLQAKDKSPQQNWYLFAGPGAMGPNDPRPGAYHLAAGYNHSLGDEITIAGVTINNPKLGPEIRWINEGKQVVNGKLVSKNITQLLEVNLAIEGQPDFLNVPYLDLPITVRGYAGAVSSEFSYDGGFRSHQCHGISHNKGFTGFDAGIELSVPVADNFALAASWQGRQAQQPNCDPPVATDPFTVGLRAIF